MNRVVLGLSGITLFVVLSVVLPLWAANNTKALGESAELLNLFRLFLTTCAFVGALWAIYLKDGRLRANSDNVLVSLIYFVLSTALLVVAILFSQFTGEVGTTNSSLSLARFIAFLSLESYFLSLMFLLVSVFIQSYNQLYNLRTNKFYKYFKPIRWLRKTFGPHKHYELSMEPRTLTRESFSLATSFESDDDLKRLAEGASILVTGQITRAVTDHVLACMLERMKHNETANYVVCDRHPKEIWEALASMSVSDDQRDAFVLIDCYTPSFGFTDDIHDENDVQLKNKGVALVKAKTFAGLHIANNKAFNVIKARENRKGRNTRRPMMMVYANVSALCELESVEQYRVFWRHVIPSERSYGMLTVIMEHELANPETLNLLRQLVDFELNATLDTNGNATFCRKR